MIPLLGLMLVKGVRIVYIIAIDSPEQCLRKKFQPGSRRL
jgi:hypothetical protein